MPDDKQDSADKAILTVGVTKRQLYALILAVPVLFGGGGYLSNAVHPIMDDRSAATIGKTFADITNQSNERLVRSIEGMNAATRDLAQASREQNEWCKMVIGEFTKELRLIKEEIIYSRELQVKAAHERK